MSKNQELTTDGQNKNIKWNFQFCQQKLLIEAFTQITYKGQFAGFKGVNLNQLVKYIQNGQFTILVKTTTQMQILVGFITITLNSQASIQINQLKSRITKCQQENQILKSTIDQLRANQHNSKWEDVDLNNAQQYFDINSDYKIIMNQGSTFFPVSVTTQNMYYYHSNGSQYTTPYNAKKTSSAGWVVTTIQRRRN